MIQLSGQSNRDTHSDLALYTARTRCSWEPASNVYRRAARIWRSELFVSRDFPLHSGCASRSDLIGGSGPGLDCGVNGNNEFCIGALLLAARDSASHFATPGLEPPTRYGGTQAGYRAVDRFEAVCSVTPAG